METSKSTVKLSNAVIPKTFSYTGGTRENSVKVKITAMSKRRIYSPLEAERLRAEKFGNEQNPQYQTRKAKRSVSMKSVPVPPTAPKNKLARDIAGIISEVRDYISHLDFVTLACVFLLSVIGIFAVHSATLTKNSSRFDFMQISMTVVGFGMVLILSFIDYEGITKKTKYILIFNAAILAITCLFGKGANPEDTTNKNWIRIGSFGIQCAEIGKPLFIITLASHLASVKNKINNIKTVIGLALHAGLIIGLVLATKDLGQATVYIVIFLSMCFASGLSFWYFAAGICTFLGLSPFIWNRLSNYQQKRILVGFNPELDPQHMGYQVIQSKTAIAAGGITGLGYKNGLISQSNRLPAKWTDMIFAVISEEFGFIGSAVVLILFFILVSRMFINSYRISDRTSGSLILAGVGAMLLYQTIENVGMCLGVLPVIGITLPFLSYGGSSVIGMYMAIGMAISVYSKNDRLYFKRKTLI